jgi:hypothetical protein
MLVGGARGCLWSRHLSSWLIRNAPAIEIAGFLADGRYRLAEWQAKVGRALSRRHLADGTLVLHDVSASCLEGLRCELTRHGNS